MIKKLTASVLSVLLLMSPLSVCAMPYEEYMSGRGTYQTTTYNLSPGLIYTEVLSSNAKYGYEQSYIFRYTPGQGTEIRPVYGEAIYGTNALKTLVEKAEQNGDRVVGGINGDFYGMSTGIPLGMMIVNGEIITSDNERSALGFDADGKAFISYPDMKTVLKNDSYELQVDHINKGPTEYGVYLMTDTYSETTTSKKPSREIVLMPYTEVTEYKTERDLPKELPDNAFVYRYTADGQGTSEAEQPTESVESIESTETEPDETNGETEAKNADGETEADTEKSGSEQTDGEKGEKDESEDMPFYARVYTLSEEKLYIGCSLSVVVKEIRTDSTDSEIPKGHFVLAAENVNQQYRTEALSEGDELTLTVTANKEWYGAVSAVGNSGGFILKDGMYCDDVEMNHYPYANPRTAVGITADGEVIFYCVDGRKNGTSGGMRIDQLSHEMKNLGCVTAMNLDGGGSTTTYVALPGAENATLRNTPSDGRERKTANSILFVNTSGRSGSIAFCEMPEQNAYVLAGGSHYVIGRPIATDKNRYPINLADELTYEYFLKEEPTENGNSIENGNEFIAGDTAGNADIYVRISLDGREYEFFAGTLYVTDTIQDFSLGDGAITTSVFDSVTVPFSVKYHTVKLYADIHSVMWAQYTPNESTLDENGNEVPPEPIDFSALSYGSIPQNGILETDGAILSSDGTVVPKQPDSVVHLAAKIGDTVKTLTITAQPYPFSDSLFHWAAQTLYRADSYGLMKGEPSDDGGLIFSPDRNMSKTEFFIVLARMLYPDIDAEAVSDIGQTVPEEDVAEQAEASPNDTVAEETDGNNTTAAGGDGTIESVPEDAYPFADAADIPKWAEKYYHRLNQSGLLDFITEPDESGTKYMYPNKPISRREVLIMLGSLCDESEVDFLDVFTDTEALKSDRYAVFINNAIAAEIFLGYTDGTLKPENNLTRAEAATVMVRFCEEHIIAN